MPAFLTPLLVPLANMIAPILTWFVNRELQKNSPAMTANQQKIYDAAQLDKIRKTIATGDLDSIRRANS